MDLCGDGNPVCKCNSLIMSEERVDFQFDSHGKKLNKVVEELQWNLKYLGGNKHARINRHC